MTPEVIGEVTPPIPSLLSHAIRAHTPFHPIPEGELDANVAELDVREGQEQPQGEEQSSQDDLSGEDDATTMLHLPINQGVQATVVRRSGH